MKLFDSFSDAPKLKLNIDNYEYTPVGYQVDVPQLLGSQQTDNQALPHNVLNSDLPDLPADFFKLDLQQPDLNLPAYQMDNNSTPQTVFQGEII